MINRIVLDLEDLSIKCRNVETGAGIGQKFYSELMAYVLLIKQETETITVPEKSQEAFGEVVTSFCDPPTGKVISVVETPPLCTYHCFNHHPLWMGSSEMSQRMSPRLIKGVLNL